MKKRMNIYAYSFILLLTVVGLSALTITVMKTTAPTL